MLTNHKSGYTLVEIMIVVTIIALLAAVAIPVFKKARVNSQNARLASDFRAYSAVMETYILENGDYPENSNPGTIPAGLDDYVNADQWNGSPSIGGTWSVANGVYEILSAIGVHGYTVSDDQLLQFDQNYDDGDLATGTYRQLDDDRYYYVVAE